MQTYTFSFEQVIALLINFAIIHTQTSTDDIFEM